ncbi:hypothetical protein Aco04nite_36240 [Winogradskya consettensis]|uniref:Uncharacterized protein n=2 Tax=Winogradskya consettensis TaxID=113560 RepID=A0A919SLH2_9ACTN|nr:hypothetical protein Aco04nite_36240 [Actinoplanes consettensis]
MLRLQPVGHWLQRFAEFTQRSAQEIVLPAVGFSGPLFSSVVHPAPLTYKRNNLLPQWVADSRDGLGDDGVVWGSIIVEMGFLNNEALWLTDQFGDSLPQVCLVNPTVQEIIGDLIGEVIGSGVDGIVLDITDAYPNSSAPGRLGYILHCFCDFCMQALKLKGFNESREAFIKEPLLSQLILHTAQEDGGGVEHIDPPQEWLDGRDVSNLIALAIARRFVPEDAENLQSVASRLLAYMRARVAVTADAVRTTLAPARAAGRRTAVVLGDHKADLSQMVTLAALDQAKSADEYWLPFAPGRNLTPGDWRAVQFLAGRSTYYFNAFFETVETASMRLVVGGIEFFLQDLLRSSKSLMNNKLGAGSVYASGKLKQFEGFAGVPLSQDDHIKLVEHLTSAVTGDVLPPDLLKRFRIATETPTSNDSDEASIV